MRVDTDIYEQTLFPHLAVKFPVIFVSRIVTCAMCLKAQRWNEALHVLCFDWFMQTFFMCVTGQRDKLKFSYENSASKFLLPNSLTNYN